MKTTSINPELQARYEALKSEQPKLRIRNAAEALGVSEMELLELQLGNTATRLSGAGRACCRRWRALAM